MGILSLFRPGGDTISGSIEAIGKSAKDIRTALTGDIPPELRAQLEAQLLQIESKTLEIRSNIIMSEANGASWLQRNWRPITMVVFLLLAVLDSFRLLPSPLAPQGWTLLQIGLGGYVVGRSAEKTMKYYKDKQ